MKIDEKTIEEYQENGAICLRNVFSKEWREMVAKGIEKNLAEPGPLGEKLKGNKSDAYYFDDLCNWQRIPEFRKFALESPAASIAGQLMKSEVSSYFWIRFNISFDLIIKEYFQCLIIFKHIYIYLKFSLLII